MFKFVMATHGNFAKGIKESIRLIAGEFDNLQALSCYTEENFNLNSEIEEILKYQGGDIIVITDVFGGSVNNAFIEKTVENKNLHVISGLNLPLMLELLGEHEEYTKGEDLIRESIKNTSDAVHYCNDEINNSLENQENEIDEDF